MKRKTEVLLKGGELNHDAEKPRTERLDELREQTSSLKERLNRVGADLRKRLSGQESGKRGQKLEKRMVGVITALEEVEKKLGKRPRKTQKALAKTEKRLDFPADAGLKKIGKGLKRARKVLGRIFV